MYLKFGPLGDDPDFSWIIAKNPDGPQFKRPVGGSTVGRTVTGEYVGSEYAVTVHTDGLAFFQYLKAQNEPAYVRAEPWLVCPSNLNGLVIALRSALYGNVSGLTPEQFYAPKSLRAEIGPFPGPHKPELFAALGLDVEVLGETKVCLDLRISTREPMSVTEFLQKIYCLMLATTYSWSYSSRVNSDQVEKYRALTASWLDKVPEPHRSQLLARLSRWQNAARKQLQGETDQEFKRTLHECRHDLLLGMIPTETKSVVELGCGDGQFLLAVAERFPEVRLLGIEAERVQVHRAAKKLGGRAKVLHGNLLYPQDWSEITKIDVLVLSEVIEHLGPSDRSALIELVLALSPGMVLLTTPNVAANSVLYGLSGYRHKDHKIEYTIDQFMAEVWKPLERVYDLELVDVQPGSTIQPSFCVRAKKRKSSAGEDSSSCKQALESQRMCETAYFPITNVTLSSRELQEGTTSRSFLDNAKNIFYLGPTIAPVDYTPQAGEYLEHPQAAFDYYSARGMDVLIEEPKYMGSRAYLLAFKDPAVATAMGFDHPLTVNSRSGLQFFQDKSVLTRIWEGIASKMEDDYVILDAEILPWRLKADKFIDRDFLVPGEAALLWRRRFEPDAVADVEKYLRVVRDLSGDGPLEVRAFHMLARGSVKKSKGGVRFGDSVFGIYQDHRTQLEFISRLAGDILKPSAYNEVVLNSSDSKSASTQRWLRFCSEGGEGFVYKPKKFLTMSESGFPLQSALKVRGPDYLRIVYGIDYRRPEYFSQLKLRGTKKKRLLAAQEQEIAAVILRCFVYGNSIEHLRAVASFLSLEEAQFSVIDRTL